MIYQPTLRAALTLVFAFVGYALATHGAARAEAEFCGAQVRILTPVSTPASPTAVYAFALRALTERSVQGEIVADTDRGWFTWTFPKTKLALLPDHLNVRGIEIDGKDYRSDPLYVSFPSGTVVKNAWVEHVQTFGETVLGWDALGQTTCEVPDFGDVDPRGPLIAPASPPAATAIVAAQPTDPRLTVTCDKPFAPTGVSNVPRLEIPQDFSGPTNGASIVELLIKPDGSVLDAWLLGSSGNTRWDNEARIAAHNATYTAATSYCMPVNTTYYFKASFH
jgi:hypothetical protein